MAKSAASIKPWVRTIVIFPAFLLVLGIFELMAYAIQGLDPVKDHLHTTTFQETVGALFTMMGTVLIVWIFSRFIDRIKFHELGFNPKGIKQQLLIGFAVGFLLIGLGFITLIFFQQIQWKDTNLVWGDLLLEICLFVMVAFSEELLLRGYVLNNLMQSVSRVWALILSSLMFALVHILNPNFTWLGFFNILLAGILLGLPYLHTRQLWFPIALHFSWNFFQGPIFGFSVSGHEMYSLISQTRSADTIWNGGTFGFEGSLLCAFIQVILIGALWWYYHQKEVPGSETVVREIITDVEVN